MRHRFIQVGVRTLPVFDTHYAVPGPLSPRRETRSVWTFHGERARWRPNALRPCCFFLSSFFPSLVTSISSSFPFLTLPAFLAFQHGIGRVVQFLTQRAYQRLQGPDPDVLLAVALDDGPSSGESARLEDNGKCSICIDDNCEKAKSMRIVENIIGYEPMGKAVVKELTRPGCFPHRS
jgi:hypothetical protein